MPKSTGYHGELKIQDFCLAFSAMRKQKKCVK
jgi:hypothetical protein